MITLCCFLAFLVLASAQIPIPCNSDNITAATVCTNTPACNDANQVCSLDGLSTTGRCRCLNPSKIESCTSDSTLNLAYISCTSATTTPCTNQCTTGGRKCVSYGTGLSGTPLRTYCVCQQTGYNWDGTTCVPACNPPAYSTGNNCTCPSGYITVPNSNPASIKCTFPSTCVSSTDCPARYDCVGTSCVANNTQSNCQNYPCKSPFQCVMTNTGPTCACPPGTAGPNCGATPCREGFCPRSIGKGTPTFEQGATCRYDFERAATSGTPDFLAAFCECTGNQQFPDCQAGTSDICSPACPLNSRCVGGKCVCNSRYTAAEFPLQTCYTPCTTPCPENSFCHNGACQCDRTLFGGVPAAGCDHQVCNADADCPVNGYCVPIVGLAVSQVSTPTSFCSCKPGFWGTSCSNIGNFTTPCPAGRVHNSLGKCIATTSCVNWKFSFTGGPPSEPALPGLLTTFTKTEIYSWQNTRLTGNTVYAQFCTRGDFDTDRVFDYIKTVVIPGTENFDPSTSARITQIAVDSANLITLSLVFIVAMMFQ